MEGARLCVDRKYAAVQQSRQPKARGAFQQSNVDRYLITAAMALATTGRLRSFSAATQIRPESTP
jgi:hypothetical protein